MSVAHDWFFLIVGGQDRADEGGGKSRRENCEYASQERLDIAVDKKKKICRFKERLVDLSRRSLLV